MRGSRAARTACPASTVRSIPSASTSVRSSRATSGSTSTSAPTPIRGRGPIPWWWRTPTATPTSRTYRGPWTSRSASPACSSSMPRQATTTALCSWPPPWRMRASTNGGNTTRGPMTRTVIHSPTTSFPARDSIACPSRISCSPTRWKAPAANSTSSP